MTELIDKVRELVKNAEDCANLAKAFIENNGWQYAPGYKETVRTLELVEEIRRILPLKEDEIQKGTKVKNQKLFP